MRAEFKILSQFEFPFVLPMSGWIKYLLIGFTIVLFSRYELLHRNLASDPDFVKLFTSVEFQ